MARLPARSTHCPRCGGRLARDNDSGRCTPCQAAERDRLTTPPTVPPGFWEHEPVRRALADRHFGRLIRAYRCHPYQGRLPLPQAIIARWLGITQAQLSRIENGPPIVHLDRLAHWAQLLGVPAEQLWFALPAEQCRTSRGGTTGEPPDHSIHLPAAPSGDHAPSLLGADTTAPDEGGGTTDRRRFNAVAALVGLGASGCLDLFTATADTPRTIGLEQVRFARSLVDEFRRADAAAGADALCDVAVQVHARLSTWAAKASYSREVGNALQSALAELASQAAWLAIDAERRAEARPYLNEAITRARLADDPRAEVQALACLALLTREERPGESLHCVEAALRASAGWATPRLTTLLHLRTARTSARIGDVSGFERATTRARAEFERGTHEDDLPFLQFVTAHEVNGLLGLSYLALGRPGRAAESFRAITANPSTTHHRNQIMYTIDLARATYRQGDVDEAARTALAVLPAVGQLNSSRVSRLFGEVRANLGRVPRPTTTTRDFVEAYDRVVAR